MKLSKFYELLNPYATATLVQGDATIYSGKVKELPDEFDDLDVQDFTCRAPDVYSHYEFIFYVK